MRVLEVKDLVEMLKAAKDDKTRKSSLKALSALSNSGQIFDFFASASIYLYYSLFASA